MPPGPRRGAGGGDDGAVTVQIWRLPPTSPERDRPGPPTRRPRPSPRRSRAADDRPVDAPEDRAEPDPPPPEVGPGRRIDVTV